MSNSSTPGAAKPGGLSLYANLLDPSSSSSASISRAPVVFNQNSTENASGDDVSAKKQQINAAALRFQPVKRQNLSSQKPKPKSTFPKPMPPNIGDISSPSSAPPASRPPTKSTLADWTAAGDDDDVNGFYGGGEKRQRGGRKRRKKNREEYAAVQDWDDIYDPSRPNNYDEYKHSDEKVREVREWKDRLYAHRLARKSISDKDSEEDEPFRPQMNNQFAPPSNYSFAPPPMESPPPQPAPLANDVTGDDAYSRRMRISQADPPPTSQSSNVESLVGVISRAPVRYNLPPAPSELPASEAELESALAEEENQPQDDQEHEAAEDEPRSRRPGQKGFAERLMSKYGWTKGTGLGAEGTGIINPLRVQVEKRKKKPDSEGGGFADPKGVGKIIGGRKKAVDADVGKFGVMSEVVVLRGMVDGMNLEEEVEGSGDGGLMQEIGDECGEKYGNVERVYIDRNGTAPAQVFVKFTSQLSGLRAVNALEGRIFNGNTISALFYDTEKFDQGVFE